MRNKAANSPDPLPSSIEPPRKGSEFPGSAPAVHQMVVTLGRREFIERVPGQARSIRLLLSREDLPDLE